jgi:hypothetical protein
MAGVTVKLEITIAQNTFGAGRDQLIDIESQGQSTPLKGPSLRSG